MRPIKTGQRTRMPDIETGTFSRRQSVVVPGDQTEEGLEDLWIECHYDFSCREGFGQQIRTHSVPGEAEHAPAHLAGGGDMPDGGTLVRGEKSILI